MQNHAIGATPSRPAGPLERPDSPAREWGPVLSRVCHEAARLRHLSTRTEKAYRSWIRRFLEANDWRHPARLGHEEVVALLSDLATRRRLSASTQNQALAALLFLYRSALGGDLSWLDGIVRARRPRRRPVVLTRREVEALLEQMDSTPRPVATLLHAAGLRLLEALRLRVKDLDFEARILMIRSGKGDRDRRAILPESVRRDLRGAIDRALALHRSDLQRRAGWVELPSAPARKYRSAARSPGRQWVFPATTTYRDPQSGEVHRHHLHETVIQRTVREAVMRVGIKKHATPVTPSVIHSPPTCSRRARTSARSRNSSGTRTSRRR